MDVVVFFFQAEDGIRDADVTGVQTCALPIWRRWPRREEPNKYLRQRLKRPGLREAQIRNCGTNLLHVLLRPSCRRMSPRMKRLEWWRRASAKTPRFRPLRQKP